MGLETVDIIMDMEDHFHVQVPDAVFSRCVTVADLQRVIMDLLASQGREQGEALQHEVWQGMMSILAKQGYPVDRIRPESTWVGDITPYG